MQISVPQSSTRTTFAQGITNRIYLHSHFSPPTVSQNLTPEDQARQNIDQQLQDCGWLIQAKSDMNTMAGPGVAVRKDRMPTSSFAPEAFIILSRRPYTAGLRYSQIKNFARRLSIKPFQVDESQPQTLLKLWQAYAAVHPDKVDSGGKHCKHIVDLVALVRHAIDPDSPLRPVGMTVEERFTEWLSEQQSGVDGFSEDQMKWLVAIKDHIASSLMLEQDDFEYAPFNQFGGIGRAYELFGDRLAEIMEELNARLAA